MVDQLGDHFDFWRLFFNYVIFEERLGVKQILMVVLLLFSREFLGFLFVARICLLVADVGGENDDLLGLLDIDTVVALLLEGTALNEVNLLKQTQLQPKLVWRELIVKNYDR